MALPLQQRELCIDLSTGHWGIHEIDYRDTGIIGPVDYGWARYRSNPDVFTFGEGVLANSTIPGSRRLVFCAYSPQWEGFYVSTMGGAAYTFQHLGVNYCCLTGRCDVTSLLVLNRKGDEVTVRLDPMPEFQSYWDGYPDPDGHSEIGIFGLQHAILNRYGDQYPVGKVRIFATGPAALRTLEGGIASNVLKKSKMATVVDWCGRGGMGSRLLRHHNVVACVFGGDWVDPERPKTKETDAYFFRHFGDKATKVDKAATTKYSFDPNLGTGGTFGANLHTIRDRLLTFNYRSIYASEEDRLRLHANFIANHYLKQFNEEIITKKRFDHCGEPCATACKKLHGRYKKDYEPYHALGPQLGVFDQRAAELLNEHADAMGFDAIQLGGTLAWIMECIADGLMTPKEYGFPPRDEMKFQFASDPDQFDVVHDSARNSRYAIALINAILDDPRAAPFRQGIRQAAHDLDAKYGCNSVDRTVYLAHGEAGHMVPNQYWVPGMFSPMPTMGKYYIYYGQEFLAPSALGRKNVERMVYELMMDNLGFCRFHRTWAESLTDEIVADRFALGIDFKAHHFRLVQQISQADAGKQVPWESARVEDLLGLFLHFWHEAGLKDEELIDWNEQFVKDRKLAALAFWQALLNSQEAALQGDAEGVADMLTPWQKEQQQASAAGTPTPSL